MGEDIGVGVGTDIHTEVVTGFAAGVDVGIGTATEVFKCRRTSESV